MSESTLLSLALLGTARGGDFPPCPHESLDGPWQQLDHSQILPAAALESAATSTGLVPEKGSPLPLAASDPRPPIPPAATDKLTLILSGTSPECLPELLQSALASNFRAPHALIPALLDYGQTHRPFQYQISRLVGPRGHWLAKLHHSWKWLSSTDQLPDDAWETGTTAERLQWLRETRLNDPPKSLTAIQSTWKSDDPAFRQSIIQLVLTHLHPSDETFLEPALSDPRREIRNLATTALLQLPSAFRTRSLERAKPYLSLKGKKLTLTPPPEFDPTWKADGLREKPPVKTGERAWWLRQILARIPLPDWASLLNLSTEKVLALKIDPDWKEAVHLAWIDSAKFHPAPDFIPALIKLSPQSISDLLAPLHHYRKCDVIENLPPDLALPQLIQLASRPPVDNSFQKTILTAFLKDKVHTRPDARALAMCLDSSEIPPTLATIVKQKSISTFTEEFARTLEFRQSYLKPLTP
jgi:hypothetical protein